MQLISVIVPLYKGNKYIGAILNMINSNYTILMERNAGWDVELIFVNDYPNEKITTDRFNDYNFEVLLINNKNNVGIHDSRAIGIDAAHGEFIYMLDQDDRIEDDFLSSQMILLSEEKRASFVISNGYIEHKTYTRPIYEARIMHRLAQITMAYAYFDNRIISPGQCIIKKECIPEFWKKNALKKNGADDMLLWLLLLSKNKPVINSRKLYTHVNTNNNTSLDFEGMYSSVDEMLNLIRNSDIDLGISDRVLRIIEYRNSYLKKEKTAVKVNLLTKLIVTLIYEARRVKNGGEE